MPDSDQHDFWEAEPDWSADWTKPVRSVRQARDGRRRVGALCAAVLLALMVALIVRSTGSGDRIGASVTPDVVFAGVSDSSAIAPAGVPLPSGVSRANLIATDVQFRPVSVATPLAETKRRCALTYTVRTGDYWISIARAANVKVSALLAANGASSRTPLYPNRSICLPANATMPAAGTASTATTAKSTSATAKPTANTAKPAGPAASTTTASTAAPTTTAPPPPITYTRAQVEQIIRNVWPDDLEDEAVRIATRESNLVPTAHNWCCYGLFQIYFNANKASLTSWGIVSASQLFDPQINAYAAYAMYLRAGGWGPWN